MAKKDATSTQTTTPDAGTQQWQRYVRGLLTNLGNQTLGAGGIGLPDYDKQLGQLHENFGIQRDAASAAANDLATKAGAYGGDRAAILQSQAMNDVNRAENQAVTNLGITQNNTQWDRIMQALAAMQGGFTGGGSTTQLTQPGGSLAGGLLGLGMTAGGLGLGNALDKAAFDIFGGA